jgi:hypothetical protein
MTMTATPSAASATQAAHRRLKVCFRRGGARGDAVSALERPLAPQPARRMRERMVAASAAIRTCFAQSMHESTNESEYTRPPAAR